MEGPLAGRVLVAVTRLERETRSAILQRDAGRTSGDFRPEGFVDGVDERAGVPLAVDRDEIDRVAPGGKFRGKDLGGSALGIDARSPRSRVRLAHQILDGNPGLVRIGDIGREIGVDELLGLDQYVQIRGRVEAQGLQIEALQDVRGASGRRCPDRWAGSGTPRSRGSRCGSARPSSSGARRSPRVTGSRPTRAHGARSPARSGRGRKRRALLRRAAAASARARAASSRWPLRARARRPETCVRSRDRHAAPPRWPSTGARRSPPPGSPAPRTRSPARAAPPAVCARNARALRPRRPPHRAP